jgi:hypothetical protein
MFAVLIVVEDEFFETASKTEETLDITDSAAYSIQEVKLKSENDREIEEAEKKKQVILP